MRSQYEVERMKFSDLEGTVVLPTYQRRLVWNDRQKHDFIENISEGFPFGSILLYRYEGEKHLSLIDGLQRFSTLREYQQKPSKYFAKYEPFAKRIVSYIEAQIGSEISLSESAKEDLLQKVELILKSCLEDSDRSPFFIRDQVTKEIALYPRDQDSMDALITLQQDLVKTANEYLDLQDLVIPCVVFTGDESQLPEVFANLNQGGTKLSKYQVLAAHWTKHEFELPTTKNGNDILEKVIDRYMYLEEKRELEISDFDREEMELTRRINLAEFCFALGELIAEKTPVFWSDALNSENDKKEDIFNLIGYLSTAIALGVDNRSIEKLPEKMDLLESGEFVDSLIGKVLGEYQILQSEFAKWLTIPGSGEVQYESGPITDFQALSFFAALWHKRYVINEGTKRISEIEKFTSKGYEDTRINLISYCVSDVVGQAWRGSGDSKLANYYVRGEEGLSTYALPLTMDLLNTKIIGWYDEISRSGSINVEKVSRFLLCLHAAPRRMEYTAEKYDIEHVLAKKLLKKNALYVNDSIPGGVLGNLMYLKRKTNRGKQELDLYSLEEHEGVVLEGSYKQRVCYPPKTQIRSAINDLETGKGDSSKALIITRGKEMIGELLKNLPLS